MNKFPRYIAILLIIIPLLGHSQTNRWKRLRYEFFGGIGASGFLGDLGGADQIGTHYLKDFEFSMTRPAFTIGGRYQIMRRLAVQSALSYAWIRGDDRKTKEAFRNNRNIQVMTPLAEWQARLEYTVLTEKQGHRYNIRNVRGLIGNHIIVDIFGGGALFFFYPMGRDSRPGGSGKYYGLRSVGTEGQNLKTGIRKPYSLFSFSIPMGVQLKYVINRKWSVSWEVGIRQTFTDYVDDVSKTYAEGVAVAQFNKNGNVNPELAEYFANPAINRNVRQQDANGGPNTNTTLPGEQRGNNRNYDIYFLSFFTLNYKVRTGRNGLPIFR